MPIKSNASIDATSRAWPANHINGATENLIKSVFGLENEHKKTI